MVTVYTMNNCQPCKMTKRELARLGVSFKEVNLTEHPEELDSLRELGYMSAPVVKTPTDSWSGFSPSKLRELGATA